MRQNGFSEPQRAAPPVTGPLDFVINGRFLSQPTTGVQRVARELTKALDRILGENPSLARASIIVGRDARMDDLQLEHIAVRRIGWARHAMWEQLVLLGAARGKPLLCLGNTAPVLRLIAGPKVAVMVHDLSYRFFPEAYGLAYRAVHQIMLPLLVRGADPLFTVSRSEADILAGVMHRKKGAIIVAANGGWCDDAIDPEPFDQSRLDGPILVVGSFSQRKNFAGALATAIALARRDGRRSIFVGSGAKFLATVDCAIPADLRHLIQLVGQVEDPAALQAYYQRAACLLFASFYEASPMPPVEAHALGCPVIASDIPSLRERCGDAALYCDPADVASIIAAIDRLTGDPQLAADLVSRGQARASGLSWARQAGIVLKALETRFASSSRDRVST